MTWREFQLKRHGFIRQQKEQLRHTQTIAYMIYLGIPEKGKKKSLNQFWNIDGVDSVQDWQKELLKDAQKKAVEEAKQKKLKNG